MVTMTSNNGRRIIQFHDRAGRRRSVSLGYIPLKAAEAIRVRVADLLASAVAGQPPEPSTLHWVVGLDQRLAAKLAKASVIAPRQIATLGPFLADYLASRTDIKPATRLVLGHTQRCLLAYFGGDRSLGSITPGEADRWRLWLGAEAGEGLSDNTVRRRCGIAKQFFRAAIRLKLVSENPFGDLVAAVRANASRFYFVTRDEAQMVLDACPSLEWRLLFALARFGGLRVPSETLALRWQDINWATDRMLVHSPKTEHHDGGATRWVPIFPELRPLLTEAHEIAEDNAVWVITRTRDSSINLRTQLNRIIHNAGLTPWPKLWQNLRSTRETELVREHPLHVVVKWLGNSQAVAAKHYLQVTDEDFQRAAANYGAAHALQQAATSTSVEVHGATTEMQNPREPQDSRGILILGVGDTGLEPVTPSLSS